VPIAVISQPCDTRDIAFLRIRATGRVPATGTLAGAREAHFVAHVTYRVTGRGPDGRRGGRRFRNTDQGREAARAFAASLRDPRTVYDVEYRVAGREASKTFARRKDAEAFLHTVEHDRTHGPLVDPRGARVTLKDFAQDWLKNHTDIRPTTRRNYTYLLDLHIVPRFGNVQLGCTCHLRRRRVVRDA
jgi:hypothetical protein